MKDMKEFSVNSLEIQWWPHSVVLDFICSKCLFSDLSCETDKPFTLHQNDALMIFIPLTISKSSNYSWNLWSGRTEAIAPNKQNAIFLNTSKSSVKTSSGNTDIVFLNLLGCIIFCRTNKRGFQVSFGFVSSLYGFICWGGHSVLATTGAGDLCLCCLTLLRAGTRSQRKQSWFLYWIFNTEIWYLTFKANPISGPRSLVMISGI